MTRILSQYRSRGKSITLESHGGGHYIVKVVTLKAFWKVCDARAYYTELTGRATEGTGEDEE